MTEDVPDLIQEVVDELVVRGADDWIMLVEIDNVVKLNAARHNRELSWSERLETGVEAIRRLSQTGLMLPGDVIDASSGFLPWDIDQSAAIERIDRAWRLAGPSLGMGDICWLANTPAGDAYADSVRSEVNARAGPASAR